MSTKKSLHFVTSSANKFAEAKKLFQSDTYDLVQLDLDLPEYQGDSEEIAIKKCLEAESIIPQNAYPYIIEDTGLHFNCLNGLPGPYIKWFLKSIGNEGLVKITQPYEDKTAYIQCILTLKINDKTSPKSFIGKIDGTIVPARGKKDFGWDPIFEVNGKTFGEMDIDTKNQYSHRFKAFQKLNDTIKFID